MTRDSHFGKAGDLLIIAILLASTFTCSQLVRSIIVGDNQEYLLLFFLGICFLSLTITLILWGSFIEPTLLVEKEIILYSQNKTLKEELSIVHFSDLHAGIFTSLKFMERVVRQVNNMHPDLILITGDIVTNHDKHLRSISVLKNLKAKFGTFAVLGNHDYGICKASDLPYNKTLFQNVKTGVEDLNIKVLLDESIHIRNLTVTGIEELWIRKDKNFSVLENAKINKFNILLCHNPDIIQRPEICNYDLILCGHTHGGEIRLPPIGPIVKLPTKISNKFDKGLFRLSKKTRLFITSGLGTFGTRARLFNPPEIVKIIVKPISN